MTTTPDNNPSNLLPALVGCLEALLASETLPEGLIAGEIGWLDSGLASARPESIQVGRPRKSFRCDNPYRHRPQHPQHIGGYWRR